MLLSIISHRRTHTQTQAQTYNILTPWAPVGAKKYDILGEGVFDIILTPHMYSYLTWCMSYSKFKVLVLKAWHPYHHKALLLKIYPLETHKNTYHVLIHSIVLFDKLT